MALKTFGTDAGFWNNAASWIPAGEPAGADDVVFNAASASCSVSATTNALGSFDSTGYGAAGSLTVNAGQMLNIDGNAIFDGGVFGDGDVTVSGDCSIAAGATWAASLDLILDGDGTLLSEVTTVPIEINTAGTVTLGADVYCGDFTMTAGTLAGANFTITVSGDLNGANGVTANNFGITMTGDSPNMAWIDASEQITLLTINCAVGAVFTGSVYCKSIAGDGIVANTVQRLRITEALDNFWMFTGTMGASVFLQLYADRSSGGAIITADKAITVQAVQKTLTMDGGLCAGTGDILIHSAAAGEGNFSKVDMNGQRLICDELDLGLVGINHSGWIIVDGIMAVRNLTGGAASTTNTFHFGPGSHVEFSGLADFDNIAVTASTDMPPEIVCPAGGSVANCVPNNPIALFGDANVDGGGNNENITDFVNNQDYPGGLMMRGIGGGHAAVPFTP